MRVKLRNKSRQNCKRESAQNEYQAVNAMKLQLLGMPLQSVCCLAFFQQTCNGTQRQAQVGVALVQLEA
jgi:hypothetical protein